MKSFANTLLHSSCAAARERAEDATPCSAKAIDDAAIERQLGSDDREIDRARARRTRAAPSGSAASTGTRSATRDMPGLPGAQTIAVDAGLAREPPGERVLAAAGADDQNPHRSDLRDMVAKHCRSIICGMVGRWNYVIDASSAFNLGSAFTCDSLTYSDGSKGHTVSRSRPRDRVSNGREGGVIKLG